MFMALSYHSILNDAVKLCYDCEGLTLGERIVAFKIGMDFMIKNLPKRIRCMTNVITADTFLNQRTVAEVFNLPNYYFVMDNCNFFTFNVEERFDKHHSDLIKKSIKKMAWAHTEAKFKEYFNAALSTLSDEININLSKEEEHVKFSEERAHYANHILSMVKVKIGLND